MAAHRLMHHIKYQTPYPSSLQAYTSYYWCGKVESFIKDDTPLTPREKKRFEKQKSIVWKSCAKCEKAKAKSKPKKEAADE